jgi:hypothetical protein
VPCICRHAMRLVCAVCKGLSPTPSQPKARALHRPGHAPPTSRSCRRAHSKGRLPAAQLKTSTQLLGVWRARRIRCEEPFTGRGWQPSGDAAAAGVVRAVPGVTNAYMVLAWRHEQWPGALRQPHGNDGPQRLGVSKIASPAAAVGRRSGLPPPRTAAQQRRPARVGHWLVESSTHYARRQS